MMNAWAQVIITIGAAGAVIGGWWKWLRPRWHAVKRDVRAGRDTILGRDAILDTTTGRELAPALPGMGLRMTNQEAEAAEIKVLVRDLAKSVNYLVDIRQEVRQLELRIVRVEEAIGLERLASKVEHIQLLRTMEAAVNAEPGDVEDSDQAAGS